MANNLANQVRIIGGDWRSRRIVFEDAQGLRPTPDRVRETLFNWLQADIAFSRCLDLYAGSGALGFEAASRGARRVVMVESNPHTCRRLQANVELLAAHQVEVKALAVERFLQQPPELFDLVFLDPPFLKDLLQPVCQLLETQQWLTANAKIYVEAERRLVLNGLPQNWQNLKSKAAGEVAYYLFQRQLSD